MHIRVYPCYPGQRNDALILRRFSPDDLTPHLSYSMDTFGASYFIDVYLPLYGPKFWPKGGSGGGGGFMY